MPSPTIKDACKNFSMIKKNFGLEMSNTIKMLNIFFLFYPILVLLFLILYKPKIVMEEHPDTSHHKLSYYKLIMWFIILQLPLVFYLLLTRTR